MSIIGVKGHTEKECELVTYGDHGKRQFNKVNFMWYFVLSKVTSVYPSEVGQHILSL